MQIDVAEEWRTAFEGEKEPTHRLHLMRGEPLFLRRPPYPAACRMWQFLYFLPLPHGQGSLRPTFSPRLRIGSGFLSPLWLPAIAALCWLAMLASLSAPAAVSWVVDSIDHSWKLPSSSMRKTLSVTL